MAAYVAALLSYAKDPNFSLSEGVSKDLVDEKADELFEEFEEYCNSVNDFDYEDFKEAPIGLTGDEYKRRVTKGMIEFEEILLKYRYVPYFSG